MLRISFELFEFAFEWFEFGFECFESLSDGSNLDLNAFSNAYNLHPNASNTFRMV